MRGGGLLAAGDLRVGETLRLPGGESVTLRGTPMWARLHGSHDPALWLVYLGFAGVLAGSVMLFIFKPMPVRRVSARPQVCVNPAIAAAALLMFATTACRSSAEQEARRLVTRYNEAVSEAYRRGDVKLVDGVVGLNEGKKLTGLIGVRSDLGLTLDSQMLSLEITGVKRDREEMRVQTKERWKYCDRKIGTGEKSGDEGIDSYEMLYVFKKENQAWLVDEITFITPPQVGRKPTTWATERKPLKPL